MKRPVISEDASYTFSDFFKLDAEREEILAYFGYSYQVQDCTLPQAELKADSLSELKERLTKSFFHLSLTSEMARREFLMAPVLLEVAFRTDAKISVEYNLKVSQQLKGTLDYYIRSQGNFLVVEAKNADLERGFTQLAVEMIALDQWIENETDSLYGAVSIGDVWRFGILNRQSKQITQDIHLYRVPTDLEELMAILIAILNGL